ncbi:di-trans,poly-cis-decaprenylcistransferase [Candidatus Woesearchaeota archaeon]|nr:di-trans,poly-cis-decaprenylcistransferase [Candidatus Woesearchaeota archaeon]
MDRKTPNHVAIILDGNRRYAKQRGMPTFRGHEKGFEKVGEAIEWSKEAGVKELTLYCFSTENFKRSREEVNFLFQLFRKKIREFIADQHLKERGIRIRIIGRLHLFPKDIQEEMNKVMEQTKENGPFTLNLAMGYGSRAEITDALFSLVDKGVSKEELTEGMITDSLSLPQDVDLFIRPGGEKRLSNFLLWQCSYAELIFLDTLWPEFTKEDFRRCLDEYANRERRFGN